MNKRKTSKLVLSRESLRVLDASQLHDVASGTIVVTPVKSGFCPSLNVCPISSPPACVPRSWGSECLTREGWC